MVKFVHNLQKQEQNLKNKLDKLFTLTNRRPLLVVVQVGDIPASTHYIKNKIIACKNIGILTKVLHFPQSVTEKALISQIQYLNQSEDVDGVIVQLPLPSEISESKIINSVCPTKDVDGFTARNLGKLTLDINDGFYPATLSGIITCLKQVVTNFHGLTITVVGQSNIVGKPVLIWLVNQGGTVISCNKYTTNIKSYTLNSDVIITATGTPNLITDDMIKDSAVIIDVGTSYIGHKVVGDVDASPSLVNKVKYLTPVPGGVGPLTIINLLKNVVKSYEMNIK